MTEDKDTTLITLFNECLRDDSSDKRRKLLKHWKEVCDVLDAMEGDADSD